jgi:hypothetical protein
MSKQIQSVYGSGMQAGQIGQLSRPNAPYDGDRVQIGAAGLFAGSAFKLNAAGKAIPMTGEDDASQVEGVLGFELSAINNASDVVGEYAVDAWVDTIIEGYVYGVAGEAVLAGKQVAFDPADRKWYESDLATVDQKKMLTAIKGFSGAGALVEIKVGARVPSRVTEADAAALAAVGALELRVDAIDTAETGALALIDGRVTALEGA